MSHNFHHPNHRHADSFREEHYGSYNHHRPTHHNHNCADFREDCHSSKVEAPAHYLTTDCCAETVYGRPGYGKHHGNKVVGYEFCETIREEDVVVGDCAERKHHGRFNRLGAF